MILIIAGLVAAVVGGSMTVAIVLEAIQMAAK
jgi:hypothetical protein